MNTRTILTYNYQTINTTHEDYIIRPADDNILANGTTHLTLYPTAERPGHTVVVKNQGNTDVTVTAADGEWIDAEHTVTVLPNWGLSLLNNGVQWYQIFHENTI